MDALRYKIIAKKQRSKQRNLLKPKTITIDDILADRKRAQTTVN